MTKSDIEKKCISILKRKLHVFVFSSLKKDNIIEEYGIGSIKLIEIFFAFENKFDISFTDDEMVSDNLCSIEKVVELIQEKITNK